MAAILAFPTVLLTLHHWARRDAVYPHGQAIAEAFKGARDDFVEPSLDAIKTLPKWGTNEFRCQVANFDAYAFELAGLRFLPGDGAGDVQ